MRSDWAPTIAATEGSMSHHASQPGNKLYFPKEKKYNAYIDRWACSVYKNEYKQAKNACKFKVKCFS